MALLRSSRTKVGPEGAPAAASPAEAATPEAAVVAPPASAMAPDSEMVLPAQALEELPDGWEAVIDPNSHDVYYWNQMTDATTWEHPDHAAIEDVEREAFLYEDEEREEQERFSIAERHSQTEMATAGMRSDPPLLQKAHVSSAVLSAAGGAESGTWPPTQAESGQTGVQRLRSLGLGVKQGAVAANRILERLGKPTTAPPPPLTIKERAAQLGGDLTETVWVFQKGTWKHLGMRASTLSCASPCSSGVGT